MKRLKFKNPLKGLDNAKKLIPESYKVDGKEFEMTDGNETYRLKWESSINEATALTSNDKSQINEDMQKMRHLMGFKSQDTLGTVKGAARLDENKKFNDVLNKTKSLINESKEEIDESIEEGEHIKSGMGGSNKGKSRTDKTEVLKKDSKKKRRNDGKNVVKKELDSIEESDKVDDYLEKKDSISALNTKEDKIKNRTDKKTAAKAVVRDLTAKNDGEPDPALAKRTAAEIVNDPDGSKEEDEKADDENADTSSTDGAMAEGTKDRFDKIFEGMYTGFDIPEEAIKNTALSIAKAYKEIDGYNTKVVGFEYNEGEDSGFIINLYDEDYLEDRFMYHVEPDGTIVNGSLRDAVYAYVGDNSETIKRNIIAFRKSRRHI